MAAQHALAYSLLDLPLAAADECDGTEQPLGVLLADARDTEPVPASRLPAPWFPRRVNHALLAGDVLAP